MKTGNIVKIYEDPVTEEKFEGNSKLIKEVRKPSPFTWDGIKYAMHFWKVNFEDDDIIDLIYQDA